MVNDDRLVITASTSPYGGDNAHTHTHTYDVSHGGIVDRIPVVKRFSVPVQTGPETRTTPVRGVSGLFPEVKRPQRGADHPPYFSVGLRVG